MVKVGLGISAVIFLTHLIDLLRIFKEAGAVSLGSSWQWLPIILNLGLFIIFLVFLKTDGGPGNNSQFALKLGLLVTTVLACFVLIEWGCRVISSPTWSEASLWRWYSTKVFRNEVGLRGPSIFSSPSQKKKLLILGDSFAFGFKVDQNKTMDANLREKYDVVNGSEVNWSIHQQADLYQKLKEIKKFDFVIVAHVLNDIEFPASENKGSPFVWLHYNSYAIRLIRPVLEAFSENTHIENIKKAYSPNNKNWVDYFLTLSELKKNVEADNGKLGVLIFPWMVDFSNYPFQEAHKNIGHQLKAMDIPYIDLLPLYSTHSNQDLIVSQTDLHPNDKAQSLSAKALDQFISTHWNKSPM